MAEDHRVMDPADVIDAVAAFSPFSIPIDVAGQNHEHIVIGNVDRFTSSPGAEKDDPVETLAEMRHQGTLQISYHFAIDARH